MRQAMIVHPVETNAYKAAVFHALGQVAQGRRGLPVIPLSFRDWPETAARVQTAFLRAKRRPKSRLGQWLKWQLLRGQYNWSRTFFSRHSGMTAVAWNGLTGSRKVFLDAARDAGAPVLHAELAPLAGRITLDPAGVNAESSVPSDAGFYRTWAAEDPARQSESWREMGASLVSRPSRRKDVGQASGQLPDTPFIFCPLQVPDDSQITLFSGWTGNLETFLTVLVDAVRHLPPGWHLRLKEHPSARSSLAPALAPLLATGRAVLDNDTDSFDQLRASRCVLTVNSSMGLQAFFFDKPVIVTGRALFAIPGLATPVRDAEALTRAFSATDALTFDAGLRSAFMNWLDREYYPGFTLSEGVARHDAEGFARALEQAHRRAHRRD